jgi:hypothetical protein
MRWSTVRATADVVSGILNWVARNVVEEWEAGVKSSSARVNVRWTGVRFGSESFQLGADYI